MKFSRNELKTAGLESLLEIFRRPSRLCHSFLRPFRACPFPTAPPTACAVGCILSPPRGWKASGPFTSGRDQAMTRFSGTRSDFPLSPALEVPGYYQTPRWGGDLWISVDRHVGGGSLGMDGQKRGSSGLSLDDVDFQQRFDIQVREVSSEIISEQLHVVRAGGKLSRGLSSVSA